MKHTFKLSVPYLGKAVVVSVVSFSCAISAYQLYQNTNIFSPSLQAASLKNNQVVFPGQDKQSLDQQNKSDDNYSKQKKDAKDQITPKNQSQSSFLFEQNNQLLNNNNPNLPTNNPITSTNSNNNPTNSNTSDNTLVLNPNPSNDTNDSNNSTIIIPGDGTNTDAIISDNTNNDGDISSNTGNNTSNNDNSSNSSDNTSNNGSNSNTGGNKDTTTKPDQDNNSNVADKYPDPVAKLPDVSKLDQSIFGKVDSYDETKADTSSKKYTYKIYAYDQEMLNYLGMDSSSPIYYGKEIDEWTLLCNSLFMICQEDENENRTFYYLKEFSNNFKIGEYPKKATEDFKVKFYFRYNESSPWQELEVEYKIEQSRVVLLGYDDEELESIYTDNIDGVDLKKYYSLIQDYGEVKQLFFGWSETKDGEPVDNDYQPDKKGKVLLYPTKLVDISEQFVVELQQQYIPESSKYVLKEILPEDSESNTIKNDVHVPDGIDEIEIEAVWIRQMGLFYIPKSVQSVSFEGASYFIYGDFVVDEENEYLSAKNGLLMDKDQKTLIYTANMDFLEIPETIETIEGYSPLIYEMHLKNPLGIKNMSSFKDDPFVTFYVPEEDYLECFKQWYGVISNEILSEEGIVHNYEVTDGMILESDNDEVSLIGLTASASGTLIIPNDVTRVVDNVFSDNNQVSRVIFISENIELGSQILKGSSVNEIFFLSKNTPRIKEDTFEGYTENGEIQISSDYINTYKENWKEKDEKIIQKLVTTESECGTYNGFEYLQIINKNKTSNVILLNAPSTLVEYNSNCIPDIVVNEIGDGAFSACENLKYVELDQNITKIDKHAFYGCEELEGIYSKCEGTIDIADEGLEISNSWTTNLRFISLNAKNAIFENDYIPMHTEIMFVPYDGVGYPTYSWGSDMCNKFSFKYLMDDTNGGHILYGEARGDNEYDETVSIEGQYYLIKATTQVSGDVSTRDYTFEICPSAFENVPITSIDLHMTTDSYYIDSNAFAHTNLSGEIILPDGLTSLGMGAYSYTDITRFVFPKEYNEEPVLETGVFYASNNLKEIVFQNATPIDLALYNYGTGFNFNSDSDELSIVLQGDAQGKEKEYIDSWKYLFAGVYNEDDLIWHPECSLDDALNTLQQLFNYTLPEEPEQPEENPDQGDDGEDIDSNPDADTQENPDKSEADIEETPKEESDKESSNDSVNEDQQTNNENQDDENVIDNEGE